MLIAQFTIPGTPVPKGRPRMARTGHTYTPRETVVAEEKVRWAFRAAKTTYAFPVPAGVGVGIEIDAYLPDKRGRDWDNIAKLVCDGLNKIAYADDRQIHDARIRLRVDRENPRTEVRVYLEEVSDG